MGKAAGKNKASGGGEIRDASIALRDACVLAQRLGGIERPRSFWSRQFVDQSTKVTRQESVVRHSRLESTVPHRVLHVNGRSPLGEPRGHAAVAEIVLPELR